MEDPCAVACAEEGADEGPFDLDSMDGSPWTASLSSIFSSRDELPLSLLQGDERSTVIESNAENLASSSSSPPVGLLEHGHRPAMKVSPPPFPSYYIRVLHQLQALLHISYLLRFTLSCVLRVSS